MRAARSGGIGVGGVDDVRCGACGGVVAMGVVQWLGVVWGVSVWCGVVWCGWVQAQVQVLV